MADGKNTHNWWESGSDNSEFRFDLFADDTIADALVEGKSIDQALEAHPNVSIGIVKSGIGRALRNLLENPEVELSRVQAIASLDTEYGSISPPIINEHLLSLLRSDSEAQWSQALTMQDALKVPLEPEVQKQAGEVFLEIVVQDTSKSIDVHTLFQLKPEVAVEAERKLIIEKKWEAIRELHRAISFSFHVAEQSNADAFMIAFRSCRTGKEMNKIRGMYALSDDFFSKCVQESFYMFFLIEDDPFSKIDAIVHETGIPLDASNSRVQEGARNLFRRQLKDQPDNLQRCRETKKRILGNVSALVDIQNCAESEIFYALDSEDFAAVTRLAEVADCEPARIQSVAKAVITREVGHGHYLKVLSIKKEMGIQSDSFLDDESQLMLRQAIMSSSNDECFPFTELPIKEESLDAQTSELPSTRQIFSSIRSLSQHVQDRFTYFVQNCNGRITEEKHVQKVDEWISLAVNEAHKIGESVDGILAMRQSMIDARGSRYGLENVVRLISLSQLPEASPVAVLESDDSFEQQLRWLGHRCLEQDADLMVMSEELYKYEGEINKLSDHRDEKYREWSNTTDVLFGCLLDGRNRDELIHALEYAGVPMQYSETIRTIADAVETSTRSASVNNEKLSSALYSQYFREISVWYASVQDWIHQQEFGQEAPREKILTYHTLQREISSKLVHELHKYSHLRDRYFQFGLGAHLSRELEQELADLTIDANRKVKGTVEKIEAWRLKCQEYYSTQSIIRNGDRQVKLHVQNLHYMLGTPSVYKTMRQESILGEKKPKKPQKLTDQLGDLREMIPFASAMLSYQSSGDDEVLRKALSDLEEWYKATTEKIQQDPNYDGRRITVLETVRNKYFEQKRNFYIQKRRHDLAQEYSESL